MLKKLLCKKCERIKLIKCKELCNSCYEMDLRKRKPHLYKAQLKYNKKWQKKNLKYWRDYYKEHKK